MRSSDVAAEGRRCLTATLCSSTPSDTRLQCRPNVTVARGRVAAPPGLWRSGPAPTRSSPPGSKSPALPGALLGCPAAGSLERHFPLVPRSLAGDCMPACRPVEFLYHYYRQTVPVCSTRIQSGCEADDYVNNQRARASSVARIPQDIIYASIGMWDIIIIQYSRYIILSVSGYVYKPAVSKLKYELLL